MYVFQTIGLSASHGPSIMILCETITEKKIRLTRNNLCRVIAVYTAFFLHKKDEFFWYIWFWWGGTGWLELAHLLHFNPKTSFPSLDLWLSLSFSLYFHSISCLKHLHLYHHLLLLWAVRSPACLLLRVVVRPPANICPDCSSCYCRNLTPENRSIWLWTKILFHNLNLSHSLRLSHRILIKNPQQLSLTRQQQHRRR